MNRILIIGLSGAGKSTFASKLGKNLNREVIHLDKIYYQTGWLHAQTKDEWREIVKGFASREKWIMDGHYSSTLDIRMPAADTIIFFHFNKFICLYRVFKRIFDSTQPFDKAEGNFNRVSWFLIRKIIFFPKKKIFEMLEQNKADKKIYIIKNSREAKQLLVYFNR